MRRAVADLISCRLQVERFAPFRVLGVHCLQLVQSTGNSLPSSLLDVLHEGMRLSAQRALLLGPQPLDLFSMGFDAEVLQAVGARAAAAQAGPSAADSASQAGVKLEFPF